MDLLPNKQFRNAFSFKPSSQTLPVFRSAVFHNYPYIYTRVAYQAANLGKALRPGSMAVPSGACCSLDPNSLKSSQFTAPEATPVPRLKKLWAHSSSPEVASATCLSPISIECFLPPASCRHSLQGHTSNSPRSGPCIGYTSFLQASAEALYITSSTNKRLPQFRLLRLLSSCATSFRSQFLLPFMFSS